MFGGKTDDFIDTFEFLKDNLNDFFSDIDDIKNIEDFKNFYNTRVLDIAVARDITGNIRLVSYCYISGYKSIAFSAYSDEKYRNPLYTVPCAKLALKYFFNKYRVNRIDVFGRLKNRMSRLISQKLGFTRVGIIRQALPHNGIIEDYFYSSILMSEV